MTRMARIAGGWALGALFVISGCGGEQKAQSPSTDAPVQSEPAPAEHSPPAPSQELRETPPDPEALGVEGSLPADVPVPTGAEATHPPLVAAGTTRASYDSAEPLAALHTFYKDQLVANGWTLGDQKALDGQLLLSAHKDARELTVAISESAGRSQFVLLIVGE